MNSRTSKSRPDAGHVTSLIDFWRLFQELPESYLLVKADPPAYTVMELNKAREELTGVSRDAAIGRSVFDVYSSRGNPFVIFGAEKIGTILDSVIRTGKPKRLEPIRYDLKKGRKTLTRYWLSQYIPIRGAGKKVEYILVSTHDMTHEHAVERRMFTTEQRLAAALAIGKVGSWVWDVRGDVLTPDESMARMLGLRKKGHPTLTLAGFLRTIYPEDRQRVEKALRRAVERRTAYEEEYRMVTPDGKVHWLLGRGKVEGDESQLTFAGVIVDVTERRNLQAQVELARRQDRLSRQESRLLHERNVELEAIARTKDEFVALASHQLRTPATAVKQYLGMVLQGYVGPITDMQFEMLERAFESNERQIQIINQILNAARVDTGRLALTRMPIDLNALCVGIGEDMRPSFVARRQQLGIEVPDQVVPILADLGYLRMAIENLLHNANIYTPEGGQITLRLQVEGMVARLSVSDTGVGIRKADLNKLFTKFSRIHNPLSVQAGGSGIGLYLAAEIVRLHGGNVEVESRFGKGTTFAILLPLMHNKVKSERRIKSA